MAKVTITRSMSGKANEPVAQDALIRIFDSIWGSDARSLPKYPDVIGAIHASWEDGSGATHEADSLDEILQAYQQKKTAYIYLRSYGKPVNVVSRSCL